VPTEKPEVPAWPTMIRKVTEKLNIPVDGVNDAERWVRVFPLDVSVIEEDEGQESLVETCEKPLVKNERDRFGWKDSVNPSSF
jgi:hypothetical protein